MKRKLITAIIAVALLIAGCSDTANVGKRGKQNAQ
jgi:PBP1b-binding outer membrane lipoprotein LpoB